ncbi:hypothetical protein BASH2_pXO20108 (plasmid) [Bacillus anthracis]|nr:hypothetical protein BASH2_pXO20108 [Bacillus anthracis]
MNRLKRNMKGSGRKKEREYSTYSPYKPPLIRKKDVRNIEAALNDDLTKWRAEQEYERVQERIARQQEMDY